MFAKVALSVLALTAQLGFAAPSLSNPSHEVQQQKRDSYSGQATYFADGLGACGWWNNDGDMIVAVNSPQYNGGGDCGKWLTIQNNENGQTVAAYVADECPTCDWGSLDLSKAAFGSLSNDNYDEGVFPITWWWNE